MVKISIESSQFRCFATVGSIIQLANGSTKAVEDLLTEDFIQSARVNQDVFLDQSTLGKASNNDLFAFRNYFISFSYLNFWFLKLSFSQNRASGEL